MKTVVANAYWWKIKEYHRYKKECSGLENIQVNTMDEIRSMLDACYSGNCNVNYRQGTGIHSHLGSS